MLGRRRKRILLLDDDPSMQRLVQSLLEREGYRVEVFLTGADAIRALGFRDYAVLLTGSPRSIIGTVRHEVAGVVEKPFEPPRLIEAVRAIADPK